MSLRQEKAVVLALLALLVTLSIIALVKLERYERQRSDSGIEISVEPEGISIEAGDEGDDVFISVVHEKPSLVSTPDGVTDIESSIFSTLVDAGYTPAAACGILGNISVESGFNPTISGNKGRTYGLFQWTDTGDRRSNLKNWCKRRDISYESFEGQVAFAIYELEGGDAIACRLERYLKSTDDPAMAAMEFAVGFERCIGPTSSGNGDAEYIGNIYDEYYGKTYQALGRRVANASDYYDRFKDYIIHEEEILDITTKHVGLGVISDAEVALQNKAAAAMQINRRDDAAHLWLYRILSVLSGYLCGIILGATIIAKHFAGKNIFETGSGNPGVRNTLSNVGKSEALMVLLGDVLKAMLAFLVGYLISGGALGSMQILWSGLGVILGNDYPVWNRFRGGMGVVLTIIVITFYMPIWGPVCCLAGLIMALLTKSFPIGALTIAAFAVPFAWHFKGAMAGFLVLFLLLLLCQRHYRVLVKYFHRKAYRYIRVRE